MALHPVLSLSIGVGSPGVDGDGDGGRQSVKSTEKSEIWNGLGEGSKKGFRVSG